MQIINCTKTFLGLVRSRSHSKTSIFPVQFRIPGHFGDGVGFVEGDTGLVQVRDDHFCPGGHNSGKTQPPGAPLISNSILFSLCHNCSNKQFCLLCNIQLIRIWLINVKPLTIFVEMKMLRLKLRTFYKTFE